MSLITLFQILYLPCHFFVIEKLEYLGFLKISSIVNSIGYILFYLVTYYWITHVCKIHLFNRRVSPEEKAVLVTGYAVDAARGKHGVNDQAFIIITDFNNTKIFLLFCVKPPEGCDRGFGYLLAKKLHHEGYKVFAGCYFPFGDGAKKLKEIGAGNIHVIGLDITKDDSVSGAFDYVAQNLRNSVLWAIVNNAGIFSVLEVEFTDIQTYEKLFDVNALGVVRVTKAFLPLLRKSKGRIVTMTSAIGRIPSACLSSYAMSKYAATAFCECLRQEIEPWGVKVINIEPEVYRTDFMSPDALMKALEGAWMSAPEEITAAYGKSRLEKIRTELEFALRYASSSFDQVIDRMFDAVSVTEPEYNYKPRHNFIHACIYFLLQYQPQIISDFEIRTFQQLFVSGHSRAKSSNN